MRISFDLDDTLFVAEEDGFKLEPELKFPLNRIYKERLRAGTVRLMQQLRIFHGFRRRGRIRTRQPGLTEHHTAEIARHDAADIFQL